MSHSHTPAATTCPGPTLVLPTNAAYYAKHSNDLAQVFKHQLFHSYYYLTEKLP